MEAGTCLTSATFWASERRSHALPLRTVSSASAALQSWDARANSTTPTPPARWPGSTHKHICRRRNGRKGMSGFPSSVLHAHSWRTPSRFSSFCLLSLATLTVVTGVGEGSQPEGSEEIPAEARVGELAPTPLASSGTRPAHSVPSAPASLCGEVVVVPGKPSFPDLTYQYVLASCGEAATRSPGHGACGTGCLDPAPDANLRNEGSRHQDRRRSPESGERSALQWR